ncbi:hypothetical protein [Corynebacterium pygosceleis]|uniref:Uncharacterized protein n=1 Tax=Corynebacterium pygosceleis TaxID=2800406 RepID=A0A9Q4C999_9CORY|nr:hypothetical protein [Corynebacterium pygosceleis]MCK7637960.1 hypothetical protein [Corynebacterium pygosceleis]MCK7675675.1 hypothetical protein [Corynebacterium pygosceleis]MCX7468676.1 hypothetical protein [Corynebacterium pygosceleis]
MSFYEDLAAALDAEGIESRVNDETLFVPISSGVEIQFDVTNELLPAANIYIAAAPESCDGGTGPDADEEEFEAVLVSAVFSVDAAVDAVLDHMATDAIVDLVDELVTDPDGRFGDLQFTAVEGEPITVRSPAAENSELDIVIDIVDGEPTATVTLTTFDPDLETLLDDQLDGTDGPVDDETVAELIGCFLAEGLILPEQTMGLGTYTDFGRLLTVMPFIAEHVADWEEELTSTADDYDVLFGDSRDGDAEDDDDDIEDFDLDGDDEDGPAPQR